MVLRDRNGTFLLTKLNELKVGFQSFRAALKSVQRSVTIYNRAKISTEFQIILSGKSDAMLFLAFFRPFKLMNEGEG